MEKEVGTRVISINISRKLFWAVSPELEVKLKGSYTTTTADIRSQFIILKKIKLFINLLHELFHHTIGQTSVSLLYWDKEQHYLPWTNWLKVALAGCRFWYLKQDN